MLKVKVTLMSAEEPEIRRTTLENDPDFAELERKVSELFGETTGTFTFHWKDDEGDFITMSSFEEFQEAKKSATEETLKIFLRKIEVRSKPEGDMKSNDENPGNEKDTLTPEEYGTRRWERRRRYWRGLGQDQGPLPLRRFRQAEQHLGNDQSLSERRIRGCMRRKFENRERFDELGGSVDQFRPGCGSHRNPMSSEVCREKPGSWCRWNGNYWRRRCNQRSARHFRERLDDAYMAHGSCRSRTRNRECCLGKRCGKRANSAPTTRHFGRNLNDFGMMMRRKRCRRSTSVPVCRREIDDEVQASSRCRYRRFPNAKVWIKIKEDGSVCKSFTDSASGEEKRCLRRRCKSYRRRADMFANEKSQNVNDSAFKNKHGQEPEISELVETMTLEEDKEGTEESDVGTETTEEGKEGTEETETDTGTSVSRRRNCRHRRHRGGDDKTDENQSGETNNKKYHCMHRCGCKRHSSEARENPAKIQEMTEEDEIETKRQRKCKIKIRHQSTNRDGSTKCRNTKEHGIRILTLKVRMNDDGMRPRKLARKLDRIINQYCADRQENRPWERRGGREYMGRPCGHDFERQHRRKLRRQGCRQERVRFLSPEFPRNVGENFAFVDR